jgi:hypothetical protein
MKQSYFRVSDVILLFDISFSSGPHIYIYTSYIYIPHIYVYIYIYKSWRTMVDGGRLSYCRSLSPKCWPPTTYRHDAVHFIQPLKPPYFDTPCFRFTVCSKNELSKHRRTDLAVRIQPVLCPSAGREPLSNTEHKILHYVTAL